MNPKVELAIAIILLLVAFPGGVWVIWSDIRRGKTTLNINVGRAIVPEAQIPASRSQTPGFYWFTIGWYVIGTLLALCLGLWALYDFAYGLHK